MASIYKRSDIYWIQYSYNGEHYQESLKTKDRKQANYLLAKKKVELSENKFSPSENKDIFILLDLFNKESSFSKSQGMVVNDNIRLKRYFTDKNIRFISDIKEESLIDYLDSRIKLQEISKLTANHIIVSVKKFLNWSMRKGYIIKNPLDGFKRFKIEKKPKRFLSKEEIERVLSCAKEEILFPMIATAIYTGMRKSELLRLTWEDIDFTKGHILVSVSKSKSFRYIPIHNDLRNVLYPLKSSGKVFEFVNNRRVFARIKRKTNLYGIGWHTFRHTFASQLVQQGVSIYKVSKWLGHSTTSTTEIYAHLEKGNDNDINRI